MLKAEKEAVVVAFRRYTLFPLDDCPYALLATIPHLTRSSLYRCLQPHGISWLPEAGGDKPGKQASVALPIGFFLIDITEVRTGRGKLYLFTAAAPPRVLVLRQRQNGSRRSTPSREAPISDRLQGIAVAKFGSGLNARPSLQIDACQWRLQQCGCPT